jgi:hypothetical protein
MSEYTIEISKDGESIANGGVSADCAVRLLIVMMNQAATEAGDIQTVKRPGTRPAKRKGERRKYEKRTPVDSDLMREAARRHPATQQIEDLLIEGATTAAIMEQIEVSAPTIGVIRARLRSEGRLNE